MPTKDPPQLVNNLVSEMDAALHSKYSDSRRYFQNEKNYQYMQARSKLSYKGGAFEDPSDQKQQHHNIKNYLNYEGDV